MHAFIGNQTEYANYAKWGILFDGSRRSQNTFSEH